MDLEKAYSVKTPEDNRKLYAEWAATYNDTFIKANDYVYPRTIAQKFNEQISTTDVIKVADIGCGTGAVGSYLANLRPNLSIDGFDISPEMLAEASKAKRIDNSPVYNDLIEVDLTTELPKRSYDAMISAGTFTHGHLGPETFLSLLKIVCVGGWFVVGVNAEHFKARGFAAAIDSVVSSGAISPPAIHVVDVYASGSPHYGDCAKVCIFRRLL